MKKRKKKIDPRVQQQELARFHLDYTRQVNEFLISIGLTEGLQAFSGEAYRRIVHRHNLPGIIAAPDSEINSRVLYLSNYGLKKHFEDKKIESIPGGPSFSLGFYFSTELDFYNYITKATPEQVPNLEEILQKIKPYIDHYDEKFKSIFTFLGLMLVAISHAVLVDINEMYYFTQQMGLVNLELVNQDRKKARFINYVLHRKLREEKEIMFQNEMRKVMKISFSLSDLGVRDMLIPAKDLGIDSPFNTIPLPVYIQEHALIRMSERLGKREASEIMLEIFFSMDKPKITPLSKGNALIEFRLSNCKVGYLKVGMAEGALLVQTFLFLTNNGTPEGEKLNHLLGMQKADKKYWEIDKLSTFLESDLEDNEELKQLFITAGCKSLFDYKRAPKLSAADQSQRLSAGMSAMLASFVHKTHESREGDK